MSNIHFVLWVFFNCKVQTGLILGLVGPVQVRESCVLIEQTAERYKSVPCHSIITEEMLHDNLRG